MFTGSSSWCESPFRRLACWLAVALLWLAVTAPARADAAACPGVQDGCPYVHVTVVGEGGHGVFRFAQAVAVSPDGRRVYVGDVMGYRIQAFTSDGRFITQWGRYGTGPGEIRAVGELATDAAGRVYVLDSNNDRVQVFDANGALLGSWGSRGTGLGQFRLDGNGGLAIGDGLAYVADQENHRVERFTLDPATGLPDGDPGHVLAWGSFGDCAKACTALNFNFPQGIAVSTVPGQPPDVFVADDDNHRVLKFDSAGVPLGAIDAPGELGYPYDVGVDRAHALYVVDNCDPRFKPVCTSTNVPRVDLTHQEIKKYDAGTLAPLGTWGVFGDFPGQFEFPRAGAVSADPAGGIYVAEAANNRVQAFDANGTFQRKWGISGRSAGYLSRPEAVSSDADGNVYVADTFNDRIQELDSDGRYLGEWGALTNTGYATAGSGVGQFNNPAGVAVAADGTVYVADTGNDRLQARDPVTGAWRVIDGVTLNAPRGLAIAGTRLYVADTGASLVRVLDLSDPSAQLQWTTVDGVFKSPRAVAVDPAGNLYVADTGADRIQRRDAATGTWASIGTGQLSRPSGVAIDGTVIVVADTGHDRVVRLAADGSVIAAWGARGTGNGELDGPQGIAVDAAARVLVADEFNDRLQIFAPEPAATPAPASPSSTTEVSGEVSPELSLAMAPRASFGAFTPGAAKDYESSLAAAVTSTAAGATVTVSDLSPTAPGHLRNGSDVMPQPLQVAATSPAGGSEDYLPVTHAPAQLLSYAHPVTADPVTVTFKQPVRDTDTFRSGTYSTTLTFTLSTATP
jgi:sugar lactone lactonase YvrE